MKWQPPSAACAARRLRFELLNAAFDLVEPLVRTLRGLIGRLRALGRALYARVDLIESRVDPLDIAFGRACPKAQCRDDRDAKGAGRGQIFDHAGNPSF